MLGAAREVGAPGGQGLGSLGSQLGLICSGDVLSHQQAGGRTQRSENWRLNVTLKCVVGENPAQWGILSFDLERLQSYMCHFKKPLWIHQMRFHPLDFPSAFECCFQRGFKRFLPYLFKVSYTESGTEELEAVGGEILAQGSSVFMPSLKADIS